jgi:hypothetical protein
MHSLCRTLFIHAVRSHCSPALFAHTVRRHFFPALLARTVRPHCSPELLTRTARKAIATTKRFIADDGSFIE